LKFAHFSHVWAKPEMSPHDRYEQLWRELQLCDTTGFDYAFCVEHHFRPDESLMSSPSLFCIGAGARTKRLRIGPMGYIVPLYHPLRLVEEIALVDQMLGGRMELGLVPGITAPYFIPFGIDHATRKSPTLEFIPYLRAAFGETQPFSFHGECHHTDSAKLAVQPIQKPHPEIWMQSRDPATLEFCAANGINTGYFIVYPRVEAARRYRKYIADWEKAGWDRKPKIAYSLPVYVDESDDAAIERGLLRASRAYTGFLGEPKPGDTFEQRLAEFAEMFHQRGESEAAQVFLNIFDPDYLMANNLVFVGSPKTVAEKIQAAAEEGLFNTFLGEFNFADLPEEDLMRSIRLFGEKVIPELRGFEPF
jgi:alkanesulfonate monooxygenase SsuD/methylene tetrahydromethanopterin reductase-like flavin-dependent oxidoreductase (luciferase family)